MFIEKMEIPFHIIFISLCNLNTTGSHPFNYSVFHKKQEKLFFQLEIIKRQVWPFSKNQIVAPQTD